MTPGFVVRGIVVAGGRTNQQNNYLADTYILDFGAEPRNGFLKIISVGIPTYASMKTSFHTDVSPKNWFSCQRQ